MCLSPLAAMCQTQPCCLLSSVVQVTVFLIGAYAKYNWPYVWVSNAVDLS
jgi:hypothetical protein